MMKYTTIHAFPKSYDNNTLEPQMLDLDAFDNLLVVECGESCTIVDEAEHRLYSVEAESCIEAVKKYIDWVYGEMYIYQWDSVEGGWDRTGEKDWASSGYDFEINPRGLEWELVEEH